MHSSPSPEHRGRVQRSKPNGSVTTLSLDEDELENGLLDVKTLLNDIEGFREDEWSVESITSNYHQFS